jgi:hypothetical protein
MRETEMIASRWRRERQEETNHTTQPPRRKVRQPRRRHRIQLTIV